MLNPGVRECGIIKYKIIPEQIAIIFFVMPYIPVLIGYRGLYLNNLPT